MEQVPFYWSAGDFIEMLLCNKSLIMKKYVLLAMYYFWITSKWRKIIPCHICCSVTPGNNFDLVLLLTQVLGPSLTLVFLSGTGTHTDAHRDTHRHTETHAHALTHAQTDNN